MPIATISPYAASIGYPPLAHWKNPLANLGLPRPASDMVGQAQATSDTPRNSSGVRV